MVKVTTEQGKIVINSNVYTNIAGVAASNCFGVKGMAVRSMTDGLVHLLRKEAMSKGVLVTFNDDNSITIDLHIIVDNGVNLPAVASSIISEVRYVVTKTTNTRVKSVNVFVDSMMID
ncbi:MAG: Asp23/Gls24 family envelope stress response protein [Faecousia sp.]|nr:Asp23/Gls24 family envelope stress response protein [Bacillota bacterium]MDY2719327.1 Asp23/Gls24 family envelope stress response protein [Candidatus Faecousia sp.]